MRNIASEVWTFFRKPTTPVHILFGVWCAFMIYAFGLLFGLVLLAGFAVWEHWNDKNEEYRQEGYIPEGDWDWWESAVPLCVALTPLAILQVLGIVSVGWV